MEPIKILKNNTFIFGSREPNASNRIFPIGTIFSVSSNEFIGVYHCLNAGHVHFAMNPNTKEKYRLKILDIAKTGDLMLCSVANKKDRNSWINKSSNYPKDGDSLYIYGYPKEGMSSLEDYKGTLIKAKVVFCGILSEMKYLGHILIFDKKISSGHSGSPIIDEQGLLLAVAKADFIGIPKFEEYSIGICLQK